MNFNSIITKLIFIFCIVILLFIAVFFSYFHYAKVQLNERITEDYAKISKHIHESRLKPKEIKKYVTSLGFELSPNPREVLEKNRPILSGRGFEMVKYKDSRYLHVHEPRFRLLFKDSNSYSQNPYGLFLISGLFAFFIFTFLWIIKTLKPLKDLKNEIQDFANGNLNIECKSDKKDEIAQVANEFDKAVKKISLLLESRQLFLRTVMHELKTPIAKGKIVTSLIDDEIQKDRISTVFDKLNFLIDDFAKVEQVISKNYAISKQPFSLGAIINSAVDMMMLDKADEKIEVKNISNTKLNVDFDLICLAIKNLIDNGIKYSVDKKVLLKEEKNQLLVISKGEKLTKPLKEYFKPFHNEIKSKNHGMGLGLYIVHSIVEMHEMKMDYLYEDEKNIFIIGF
jgi:two-component system OmpR family sensor kinase